MVFYCWRTYKLIWPSTENPGKRFSGNFDFLRDVFWEYHKSLSNIQQTLYKVKALNQ